MSESVKELFQRFSKPSARFVETSQLRQLAKLTEVTKAYLFSACCSLVRNVSNGHAIFRTYSSDGTPAVLAAQFVKHLRGSKIVRKARQSQEFLMERVCYSTFDERGEKVTRTCFRDPLPLTSGKSSIAQFACCMQWPTLREHGFMGLAVSHYVWDRAGFVPMANLAKRYHAMIGSEIEGDKAEEARLTDWVLANADPLHDLMNAWVWSFRPHFASETCMKDIFIMIASLRNGFDLLVMELMGWLRDKVRFTTTPWSRDRLAEQWGLLGVDEDVLEVLLDLRVRWTGSALEVDAEHRESSSLFDELAACLLGVWKLRKFTESRWLSVGPCFRALLASELLGINDLVCRIRRNASHSDYHIGGYGRRTEPIMKMVIIGSISSIVSEALMEDILVDDRVVQRFSILKEISQMELQRVMDISDDFMSVCSDLCGVSPAILRSDICGSATASMAFFSWRVFSVVMDWPWRLAVGDQVANLRALVGAPKPNEYTADKVHALMNANFSEAVLLEGIAMMADAPWSSRVVEQLHGSAAQVQKHHPDMMTNNFQCRAFIHAARSFVSEPRDDRELKQMTQRLMKVEAKTPRQLAGRHAYLQQLLRSVPIKNPHSQERALALRRNLFQQHSSWYEALSPQIRSTYEQMAADMSDARRHDIFDEAARLRTEIGILQARVQNERARTNPYNLGSSRWTDLDYERIGDLMTRGDFPESRVQALRDEAHAAPEMPDLEWRTKLWQFQIPRQVAPLRPHWLSQVCLHRNFFTGCGFRKRSAQSDVAPSHYVFCFAVQNPMYLSLACLKNRRRQALPRQKNDLMASADHWWRYSFDLDFLEFIGSDQMGDWDADLIDVFPTLTYLQGGAVVTDMEPVPLEIFVGGLPAPTKLAQPEGAAHSDASDPRTRMVSDHPWMLHHLAGIKSVKRKASYDDFLEEGTPEDDEEEVQEEATALAAKVLSDLMQVRESVRERVEIHHFRIAPLGGNWTMRHKGVLVDAYQGRAIGQPVADWCDRYHIPRSSRFAVSTFGNEGAIQMAKMWIDKMAWCYDQWLDAGARAPFQFSDAIMSRYVEPQEFTDFASGVQTAAEQNRVAVLRGLRPVGSG